MSGQKSGNFEIAFHKPICFLSHGCELKVCSTTLCDPAGALIYVVTLGEDVLCTSYVEIYTKV